MKVKRLVEASSKLDTPYLVVSLYEDTRSAMLLLFSCMVVCVHSIVSIGHGLPLSYLHGKKLMMVHIMNSASLNSKGFVNNVGIFHDSSASTNNSRGC